MAKKIEKPAEVKTPKKEPAFLPSSWAESQQFSAIERDFIQATLVPDKKYTLAQVKEALGKKMKEVVK